MFNEINGDFDDVTIRTFKVGLLAEHDLRKSLTKKLVRSVVGLWIVFMNTSELRKTSSKGRERLRLSLRTGGISGWTNTIIIGPKGFHKEIWVYGSLGG